MKKHWSAIAGLPVLLPEGEESLGQLNGAFVDPEKAQIIGFLVGYTQVLVPMEVEKWHAEAVQVSSEESLTPFADLLRLEEYGLRRTFLNSKRVVTKSGQALGRVRDFCFDAGTAALINIEVSKRFLGLEWAKRIFSAKDISEITTSAIVLNIEPEEKVKKTVNAPAVSGI